jgi:hypothetical protein
LSDPTAEDDGTPASAAGSLLLKTWSDSEAEMVRQILDGYGIACQVVSDVTHAVLPLSVDGLGEIRILVLPSRLDEAREILAEHRRRGLEIVPDGDVPEDPGSESAG